MVKHNDSSQSNGRPLRVVHIIGKMRAGGVESFVMNYYHHINRSNIQFDFIIDEDSPNLELISEINDLGGRVYIVPPYQKISKYLPTLRRLFESEGWKIVHSHMNTLSVFPLWAAKQVGVPVRIAHSHTYLTSGDPIKNIVKKTLRIFSNMYPTHRFACGNDSGKWLFGKESDYTVIPNAIDLERFSYNEDIRASARKELGIPDEKIVVGHVGRFMRQKNHAFLIEVFRKINMQNPSTLLILAGMGPLQNEIEELVNEYELTDKVMFLGQRSDPERLYHAFDVLVLPSHYEGFPVVAIEAQASGLPCMLSDSITKEADLVGLVTFLPLSMSSDKWAAKSLEVAEEMQGKRMAGALSNDFDINTSANVLANIYESMLAR